MHAVTLSRVVRFERLLLFRSRLATLKFPLPSPVPRRSNRCVFVGSACVLCLCVLEGRSM